MEIILTIIGIVAGFLVALGWYKRGLVEMEKELETIKNRMESIEKDYQGTHTDLEVIKNRIGYMECKIDEIHKVIMRPIGFTKEE